MELKKAIGYARYSSDNQTENSIEAQVKAIEKYCRENLIDLVNVYIDRAETGTNDAREGFQSFMADISAHAYDYALFYKSDRLARNKYDSVIYKKKIRDTGAEIIFIAGTRVNLNTVEGVMIEAFSEAQDQITSMNIAKDTLRGMVNIARKGLHTGGIPPLGYDIERSPKDASVRRFVVNPVEAEIVRLIFDLFLQNYGYFRISQELNGRHLLTKRGKPFTKNSVHEILKNEKYIGVYIFNKHSRHKSSRIENDPSEIVRVDDAVPAIVSKDIFLKVQLKLNTRTKPHLKGNRHYLLTGKLVCAQCGRPYVGCSTGNGGRRYYYYMCTNKKNSGGCRNHNAKAERLEKTVLEVLLKDLMTPERVEAIADACQDHFDAVNKVRGSDQTALVQQKAALEIKSNALLELYLDEGITKEQFATKNASLKADLDLITHRLETLEKSRSTLPDIRSLIKSELIGMTVEEVYEHKKLANAFISEFLDNVEICDHGDARISFKVGDPYGI